jgi:hypothetical protein
VSLAVTVSLVSDNHVPEQLAVSRRGRVTDVGPASGGERLGLSSPIRTSPYLLCAVAEHDREITVLGVGTVLR